MTETMKTKFTIALLLCVFFAGCATAPNRWARRSVENQIEWQMQEDWDRGRAGWML